MQAQILAETENARRFALVFEIGDEVLGTLTRFAEENGIRGAHFTAIGAFENATLAFWNWDSKAYENHDVNGQMEVASMTGNVSVKEDGSHKVHAHVVTGHADGSARAGHLVKGTVRPTLELFLTEAPVTLTREQDEETGLALITPGAR